MTVSRASLIRRGWVVPLCVVLVTVVAVIVAGTRSSYYRTQASLVVYGQGTAVSPPSALAVTYSGLIERDAGVANAIARVIHVPAGVAAGRLSATAAPGSAIITITYSDPSAKKSWAGVWAALQSVTGAHPTAIGIPPHLLRVVSGPGTSSKQSSKLPGGPVPVGIVLGLFLGIAVFLAWERADARADDGASLERELGLPVSEAAQSPGSWVDHCSAASMGCARGQAVRREDRAGRRHPRLERSRSRSHRDVDPVRLGSRQHLCQVTRARDVRR